MKTTHDVLLELLKAGLWGNTVRLSGYKGIDFNAVYTLAQEQAVVGLIAAGLENVVDVKVPQILALNIAGEVLQLEQRNQAMNAFIAKLVDKMRTAGIYMLLVKGQGIAQCYEKPYWRSCGDVDLFLSNDNYEKAKAFLMPLATSVEKEYKREKHLGMTIEGWVVELHGRLYSGLSSKIERELDDVYVDTFNGGNVRSWNNNGVQVFQLGVENDVFYVFAHILQHFYKEGVGLRQICDWCRLMWTFRDKMDVKKLEARLKRAGIMTEWRAFGAFAVGYLGMPEEAMPLYSADVKWKAKAEKIKEYVLNVGNFGHNRDTSYMKRSYLVRKCVSMGRRVGDLINHARIFPLDSLRFFPSIMWNGVRSAVNGE